MLARENHIILKDPSKGNKRRLAYYEWGDFDNPRVVICVHGLTRNGRDFDYLAAELSKHYRVICPDMAGRGKSDNLLNPLDYNFITYTQDCLQLISQLKIPKLHWVGTSMGGIIAIFMINQKPELISRLVMNDVGPFIPAFALEAIGKYTSNNYEFNSPEQALAYFKQNYTSFLLNEEGAEHILEHGLTKLADGKYTLTYDRNIINNFTNVVHFQDLDLWKMWKAVKQPCLVLRGENSIVLDKATAEKMVQNNPQSKLVEISQTGHPVGLMVKEEIDTVKNWLLN